MVPYFTKKAEYGCSIICPGCGILDKYYIKNVLKEIKSARISSRDKVLCIGAGPAPCTAMLISKHTGCRVVAVDSDMAAVECARKTVAERGMEDSVEIVHCDGRNLDVSGFSVVHIAKQVTPQREVFKKVWDGADPKTRIIQRFPRKALSFLYGKTHKHNKDAKEKTIVFTKGGKNEEKKYFGISGRNNSICSDNCKK